MSDKAVHVYHLSNDSLSDLGENEASLWSGGQGLAGRSNRCEGMCDVHTSIHLSLKLDTFSIVEPAYM